MQKVLQLYVFASIDPVHSPSWAVHQPVDCDPLKRPPPSKLGSFMGIRRRVISSLSMTYTRGMQQTWRPINWPGPSCLHARGNQD